MVGRWGGDEFMALVDGSFHDAEDRAQRVEDWVNGEYLLQGHPVQVRASVGIAAWQGDKEAEKAAGRADQAR